MAQSVWTVPAARMKRRLEHALPLPRQCMDMRLSMLGERCPRPSSSRPRARSPCSCPRTPALCTQGSRLWEDPAQCTASGKPFRRQRAPAASGTATSSRRSLPMRVRGPSCQQPDGLHGIAPGEDAVARRALMLNCTHDLAVVPLHGCMVVAEHRNGLGICILKARPPCGALDAELLGREALALAVPKIDSDFGCAADAPPLESPGAVVQLEPEAAASEPPSVLFGLDSVRPAVELAGHEDAAYQHGAQPKALRGRREERGERPGAHCAPGRRSGGARSSQHRIANCTPSSGSVKSVG